MNHFSKKLSEALIAKRIIWSTHNFYCSKQDVYCSKQDEYVRFHVPHIIYDIDEEQECIPSIPLLTLEVALSREFLSQLPIPYGKDTSWIFIELAENYHFEGYKGAEEYIMNLIKD